MKFPSYSGVSLRYARRFLFLLNIAILFVSLVILFITVIRPANQNLLQQISRTQITKTSRSIDVKKGELPFIHRPPLEAKVLRALLTFYPNDQKDTFESEFRWFYLSWTEMMSNESSLWRTDLIVYTAKYEPMFKSLDCVYDQVRQNSEEKPKCRIFPYIRVKDRGSTHESSCKHQVLDVERSKSLLQNLRAYGYIDSINTVFEYYSSYSMYDYILRTDLDCFLTKNFALYVPYENSLLVGHGGYSTPFNNNRLKRIAHDMNWGYADKNSLGSTWYGPPSMIYRLANYTLQAMLHLAINEFTRPEREHKVGVMLWPDWHYAVLLLYGGHLAINHLMATENFDVGRASQLLDQGVTSKDQTDIVRNHRLHLHCWHGHEPFSKFAFKEGKYDRIHPASLISDTSSSGLAMRMALQSKLMTLEELKQKLLNAKK